MCGFQFRVLVSGVRHSLLGFQIQGFGFEVSGARLGDYHAGGERRRLGRARFVAGHLQTRHLV